MAIPGPGVAISVNTVVGEFGGTAPHSLNEYYRGGGLVPNAPANAAIPTAGQIALGNFYGATNRISVPLTIGANTYNYDVYANRGPAYVAGISDVVVTVPGSVTVGSTSTGAYAMLVPSAFSPTDTVTIVNNGVIQGMGGAGGIGGWVNGPRPGGPGGVGGNALYVNRPVTVTNNGTLAGGGGGGGGGAGANSPKGNSAIGGGGGGGAGFNGGSGGGSSPPGTSGSPGSSTAGGSGGAGGTSSPAIAGAGGPGGGRGAAGSAGSPGSGGPVTPVGSGGGAGNYIVGNPFVTWPATGTRQGGVA